MGRKTKVDNRFPFVMITGFGGYGDGEWFSKFSPYYGGKGFSAADLGKSYGVKCFTPSIGPFSGNWDRACELWAQIVGGTVDYGKAHSEKFNHARFGRTYKKPLIPDWGKLDRNGKIKKINLVGHSFGGPTMRIFLELLANGSEEERAVTPDNELSDLFKGGKIEWIHTATGLASVYNGAPVAELLRNDKANRLAEGVFAGLACVFGNTPIQRVYDFGLDQYGISSNKGCLTFKRLRNPIERQKIKDGFNVFVNQHEDAALAEMDCGYSYELSQRLENFDSVYYFSYAGCRTKPLWKFDRHIPLKTMSFNVRVTAPIMGFYKGKYTPKVPGVSWAPNDGCCSVISAIAPLDRPQADFVADDECKPGIWYKMPVEDRDHLSYMGIDEPMENYYQLFSEIFERSFKLPAIQNDH